MTPKVKEVPLISPFAFVYVNTALQLFSSRQMHSLPDFLFLFLHCNIISAQSYHLRY